MKRVYDNLVPEGQFAFSTAVDIRHQGPGEDHHLMDKLLGPGEYQKMFDDYLKFPSVEEYKEMAINCGYSRILTETDVQKLEWEKFDDAIDTFYGWFQGVFDISKLDEKLVQEVKEEYEKKSGPAVRVNRTFVRMVLTK